ncbi:3-oxoacyl-[acyl-carrier-protein] synthase III C-terminal domain-containing protein [Dactylosporangium matsuzakiense]|uniref:3-oxoacyl-ACP synthase n=1 Tax=Dactylosporangium matsuzakiense TaxID=53360 RepID=A0A9W6KHE8_9ACTN|nr:3-oxoacyl-[acyl-carrier-protein] synthase III C-terminal domain-containing protein [Dactylosporangium matsuzakiense]UWZ42468.1 3-oxoacyl-ACP synthase [Dactylosporangium matsuzakiense]GLL00619.1 3-oxoacyl-ACP synthase [Dactylosporangium matsuzakiense]
MTSLLAVSTYLPDTVALADLQESLGLDHHQLRRFNRLYGLDRICQSEQSEAELLIAAASKLDALAGQEDRVKYVIRAKGLRTTAPYPISPLHEVRDALGLHRARTFAVSDHGCASGLLAVDVAATLLAADGDPDALALILAGDKTATPFTQVVVDVSVMGEGVAAVLVGADGDRDRMLGYAARVHGRTDGLIDMTPENAKFARRIYQDALAEVVHAALDEAGLTLDDLALILPHNVNRVSWTVAADNLGLPKERIFLDNMPLTGHCFCADPFINHERVVQLGRLRPGDKYLMTAAGLGQAFAAMVFEH